jgi:hypothetical protein
VADLTREEFDAIEFDAAISGDHESAAKRMSKLAVTGVQSESMPRSEAYLRAGEQWLQAGDPAAAASGFRLAMADGGPVFADPRVPLARALFQLDRVDEARTLIDKLKAEGRTDPRTCDLVAELLVERSDLPGALDWATAGVELYRARMDDAGPSARSEETVSEGAAAGAVAGRARLRAVSPLPEQRSVTRRGPDAGIDVEQDIDDRSELRMLLSLRYRVRNDLGLPEDEYDRLLDDL